MNVQVNEKDNTQFLPRITRFDDLQGGVYIEMGDYTYYFDDSIPDEPIIIRYLTESEDFDNSEVATWLSIHKPDFKFLKK